MASWDDVRAQHRPVQGTLRVPMLADLIDEIETLETQARREQLIDERENREPVAPRIAEKIQQLEAELAESEVEFTFRALGRRPYAALLAAHPPTDEQQSAAKADGQQLLYNPDTFPPALLAAACASPEGTTVEDMTDVWENWSEGQVAPMWNKCLTVNLGSADVGPKSLIASAILDGSAKS